MSKKTDRKEKSEAWKQQVGWYLTPAEKTARIVARAKEQMAEHKANGKDEMVQIYADLLKEMGVSL